MDFAFALHALQLGNAVARFGWNGAGQYLELQEPDAHSKMTLPYIYINTVQGDRVPWLASQTDLLASDWYVWETEPVVVLLPSEPEDLSDFLGEN